MYLIKTTCTIKYKGYIISPGPYEGDAINPGLARKKRGATPPAVRPHSRRMNDSESGFF